MACTCVISYERAELGALNASVTAPESDTAWLQCGTGKIDADERRAWQQLAELLADDLRVESKEQSLFLDVLGAPARRRGPRK